MCSNLEVPCNYRAITPILLRLPEDLWRFLLETDTLGIINLFFSFKHTQMKSFTRSRFIRQSIAGSAAFLLLPFASKGEITQERPPQLSPEKVKAFVGASHSKFDQVKEMYEETPALIHSAWDWGGGDFELPIGAASHVGNLPIVEYLLERGAVMNLHTACLLGKIDIVKPLITAFPNQLEARGPHGFTPLHHAIRGGEDAREVKDYLEALGATKTKL